MKKGKWYRNKDTNKYYEYLGQDYGIHSLREAGTELVILRNSIEMQDFIEDELIVELASLKKGDTT